VASIFAPSRKGPFEGPATAKPPALPGDCLPSEQGVVRSRDQGDTWEQLDIDVDVRMIFTVPSTGVSQPHIGEALPMITPAPLSPGSVSSQVTMAALDDSGDSYCLLLGDANRDRPSNAGGTGRPTSESTVVAISKIPGAR
jgi:hypothetical protein